MLRVAMLSVHTCPLAPLGGWETGGMNVYVRALGRQLSALGLEIDIYTRRQAAELPAVVEPVEGMRVLHLEAGPPVPLHKERVVEYLPEFVAGVERQAARLPGGYDLIHAHYWLSAQVGLMLKAHWGVPLVVMFHTLARMKNRVLADGPERESARRAAIEQQAMLHADRVIAASAADRRQLLEHYLLSPAKISVVPGGVDLDRFRPLDLAAARAALGLTARYVLLYVGRIQRLKGIDLLLGAAARLARDYPALGSELAVLIVGGRPNNDDSPEQAELRRLRALACQLGIADRVQFVGAVAQEQLPLYYAAADATVVPSLYESFGLVAIESMACGTPVVAARVGGLASTVRDGETGFLVPTRDPARYAERLAQLLSDRSLRARLAHQARRYALRYDWAQIAEEIYGIYCGLVHCEHRLPLPAAAAS
ncbi:MAG TPA: glycosyltransferase [Chloroflexota bacterium]|jgi:D-inositol-3-phosphate glycosyltransferase|nr:glycosyltransferase [Chloroflexota bacterium]